MGIFTTILPTCPNINTFVGLPTDQDDWYSNEWQIYSMRMTDIYGQQKSNEYLLTDFGRVGSFSNLGYSKYDCDFIKFLKSIGLEYNSIVTNIYCTAENITEIAEKTSKTGADLGSLILPIALIGGVFYLFGDEIKKAFK